MDFSVKIHPARRKNLPNNPLAKPGNLDISTERHIS